MTDDTAAAVDFSRYEGATPGPWAYGGQLNRASNFADHVATVTAENCRIAKVTGGITQEAEIAKANARLIADAPLLLSALRQSQAENVRLKDLLADAVYDLESTLVPSFDGWECTEDALLGGYRAALTPPTGEAK